MSKLIDMLIEWLIGNRDELTPEQRVRLAYLARVLESPDAIDAELEADAKDRPKDAAP